MAVIKSCRGDLAPISSKGSNIQDAAVNYVHRCTLSTFVAHTKDFEKEYWSKNGKLHN